MVRKKVIDVITRLSVGGATIHVVNLSHGLKPDFDTLVISGQIEPYETDMSYYATEKGVEVKYLKNFSREINLYSDFKSLIELYRIFRKEKPYVVHTHTSKAGFVGRLAAYLARVPVIIHTFHGNVFKGYFSKRKTKLFIFIERFLAKISTNIIAISEKQKQELIDFNITHPDKIKIIKLGFNFANILADAEHVGLFRKQFEIPKDALIIATIGRITAIKNLTLFLDIAEKLKEHDIYFAIVGDGDKRYEIQSEIDKKELSPKVFITGFFTDLKSVYADTDIACLTSLNEGTPVALIEAMANRKVVISTNVGGISDFIDNGVNGFYINGFCSDSFVDIIKEYIYHKEKFEDIMKNAPITASEHFSIKRLIDEIKSLVI